ncbi:hypothetical protein CPB97_003857 [Podila verticillata]|nr:hypothetical protein CPB97_003857 [Podila verticillata]
MERVLRPASSSIQILGMASGHDFTTIATDASGPTKRSFFDNISKAEDASDSTAGVTEFKLVNSSKRPVVIFVESVGSVHALLLDKSFKRPGEAPTPIVPLSTGIARELSIGSTRRTVSSSSSIFSAAPVEGKDPLPTLPKIASDLPLEWDSVVRDLESFVIKLRKAALPNADRYANEFQRKYDDIRQRFEVYGSASGLSHRWSDHDFDEMQRWVEAWLCRDMYNAIFSQPNSEDYLLDEQLQAKIAALNFLDLTLEHLGFVLEHPEDVAHIAQVVHEGGLEMQKLGSVKSPSDKMKVILSCHRVVVDALSREPAVQEMLAGVESSRGEDVSNNFPSAAETDASLSQCVPSAKDGSSLSTTESSSKSLSMPRIPMDGVIPRLDPSQATVHVHSPRIPMDEGYERPSLGIEECAAEVDEPTKDKVVMVEDQKQDVKKEEKTDDIDTTSEAKSSVVDIKPSEVPLPDSPVIDHVLETPVSSFALLSSSTRRQYSADVLIPLLIFSVVKSNPPMLISNLRYIQRFKVQDHLTGELAYCLTNMMAVVSFLETLDPQALGLSNEIRVLSDTSDIRLLQGKIPPVPLINLQDGLDQTKALGHKVGQEIVGVAEEGLKVISDVVQDGYSKFFGRFLTATDSLNSRDNLNRANKPVSAASSLAATAAADAAAASRLSTEDTRAEGLTAGLVTPAVLTNNVTALPVNSPSGTSVEINAAQIAKERVLTYIHKTEGPQIQYMACTNADDLRLSDVKLLLQDYQRIGKILAEMKKLAS